MADTLHTYVRNDTTPKDDRDNLRSKGQTDRELESFQHDEDQPENHFNDDFRSSPERTDLEYGQTLRASLSADVGGDATHSVAPSLPRTHTFGKRRAKSRSRGHGRTRGLENGRER